MKKGKKIALFVSMVVILAAAAVLNVTLLANNAKGNDDDVTQTGSFFATSRQDRLSTRNYEIAQLNEILALEGDEYIAARQSAAAQKQAIVDAMETELLLEVLLGAQGYDDVLVSVSTTSQMITIIVDKDNMTLQDTIRLYNAIEQETSISSDFVNFIAI